MSPAARLTGLRFGQANLPRRKLVRDYRLPVRMAANDPPVWVLVAPILGFTQPASTTKTTEPAYQIQKWLDQLSQCIYDQFAPAVRCRTGYGFDSRRTKPRTRPPAAPRIGDNLCWNSQHGPRGAARYRRVRILVLPASQSLRANIVRLPCPPVYRRLNRSTPRLRMRPLAPHGPTRTASCCGSRA